MSKKVKSFNVEEKTYDSLVALFKKHESSVSLSSFVERCLVSLEGYLREVAWGFEGQEEERDRAEIMRHVIEKTARECRLQTPEWAVLKAETARALSDPEEIADEKWKQEMDEESRKEEEETEALRIADFWKDDYEATKKGFPRQYLKFIRTGEYLLSRDKKFLIEKATGARFVAFGESRIVKLSEDREVR